MRHIFTFLFLCLTITNYGQNEKAKLIELGNAYSDYMFQNEPTKQDFKNFQNGVGENLKISSAFIIESLKSRNKLLTNAFLTMPTEESMKQIYIVCAVNNNIKDDNPIDNNKLVDSLSQQDIPHYELVDNYYDMLFTGVGNKNQPFNLSRFDLKLNTYNLKDDTEKGIVFLNCTSLCGTTIWGYMNIVKPANTKLALEFINKFPTVDGHPYYQYNDFNFPDFQMMISDENGPESYKAYYINKFFETLIYHMFSLKKQGASEEVRNDLILGSILKDSRLYKYTKYQDLLEELFQEVKK
jgi:hypothetical protein